MANYVSKFLNNDIEYTLKDSNAVHKTGDESIAGDKTFTGYIKGQAANYTNHAMKLGTNGVDYMDFYEYGGLWNFYKSRSGTNTLVAKIAELTTSTNDETLATTNWVNSKGYALDSDVVKTSGSQTVDGIKNFTSGINIGDSTEYRAQLYKLSGGSGNLALAINKQDNSGWLSSIVLNKDGTININPSTSVTAPTPATSDNSTKIATTAFVNSRVQNLSCDFSSTGKTTLSLALNTPYAFAVSGYLVITINVKGQTDPTVTVLMSNTSNASSSSFKVCSISSNGGTAEHNNIPFSIYVEKGQSIYLHKTGGGSATVEDAFIFATR